MQPGMFRFSGGETARRPDIDTFGRYLIIFGRFFRGMSLRADSAILAARIFISLYIALVYLKSLPELGLAPPLQRKKLSAVMASDH